MGTLTRGMPSVEAVGRMITWGTGGATGMKQSPVITVSVPIPQDIVTSDGTGNGGFVSWVNPHNGTILVTDCIVYFSTTGTGTYDLGISDAGTGTLADIMDGAAMNILDFAIRAYGTAASHTTLASTAGFQTVFRLGPGGTGTNNSIVGRTTEPTSTALGRLFITYIETGT